MQRRLRTLPESWPKTAILMNSMPACSLKALLTKLHASCTTHSSSHGKAFHGAETDADVVEVRSSILSVPLDARRLDRFHPQWRQRYCPLQTRRRTWPPT